MNFNPIRLLFAGRKTNEAPPKAAPAVYTGLKIGSYGLRIPESVAITAGNNLLKHAQQYTLRLGNEASTRCNCGVWIDGKHVGTWRINAGSEALIERPVVDVARFTFYALGTEEARMAGLANGNPDMGVVKAIFVPEQQCAELFSSVHVGAEGGTGYSGSSNQQFMEAEDIELDESQASILRIKLSCSDKPRPLVTSNNVGILI